MVTQVGQDGLGVCPTVDQLQGDIQGVAPQIEMPEVGEIDDAWWQRFQFIAAEVQSS